MMKKIIVGLCLVFSGVFSYAQNGLENVIVEKYYISDSNDASANPDGGVLPVGSVTYRIYADMLPGYKFQAVYGVPGHELRIATTTLFFNNEDRGATSPTYTKTQAANNTVMLDSWLSVGAACTGNFGILKANDDGVATVVNTYVPQVLQNADTAAGIPLTTQDGFIAGAPEAVTTIGISTEMAVFDNQNDGTNGPVFTTWNGSWASLNGSTGPDTIDNKVLIAQITTDGIFSFELNIQIGTSSGGVENYVAQNPIANEILLPSLTYTSVTSVANLNANSSGLLFTVYPNPAKNLFTMEISSSKQTGADSYTLYDLKGNAIFHKELGVIRENHLEQVDVSFLAKGIYMIKLSLDGIASSRQIIIN